MVPVAIIAMLLLPFSSGLISDPTSEATLPTRHPATDQSSNYIWHVNRTGNWSHMDRASHVQRRSLALMCYQMDYTLGPTCLKYGGYGCYCGAGGYGRPVDSIDRCCQEHDYCYSRVNCKHSWYTYFVHYGVWCSRSSCRCYRSIYGSCAYTSCQCDRQFAECLRYKYMSRSYMHYNRRRYC